MPKNAEAIKRWVGENRPDLISHVDVAFSSYPSPAQEAFILLLTVGFEAGRMFQKENPTAPDGPEAY